jgi:hypothetical protein
MSPNLYVLEVPELKYSQEELVKVFEHGKDYARLKGLKWKPTPVTLMEISKALCVVIQYGENMMLDNNKKDLSYDFLQHDYVKNIMERLNFSHPITSGNIDIIWYRPGFEFEPHVDHYAAATMMWPILPNDGGAPIDFYHNKDVKLEPGVPNGFKNVITEKDLIHTHYYSIEYPTIFNSHWIHGVRRINHERVYLRLRINESFDSIVKKYNEGTLVR